MCLRLLRSRWPRTLSCVCGLAVALHAFFLGFTGKAQLQSLLFATIPVNVTDPTSAPLVSAEVVSAGATVLAIARVGITSSTTTSITDQGDIHPEVYLINLDARVDKCYCMQKQLEESPWPVHRFSAITNETVDADCPDMWFARLDKEKGPAPRESPNIWKLRRNKALVCSNTLIWQRFLDNSAAQHLIIFEDDAIVHPSAWDKLRRLLASPCQDWDYLMIDPTGHGSLGPTCGEFNMASLEGGHSGTHLQVFNRAAAQFSLDSVHRGKTAHVMDKFFVSLNRSAIKAFAVTADIVHQADHHALYVRRHHLHKEQARLNCSKNVSHSDRSPKKLNRRLAGASSASVPAGFSCGEPSAE